MSAQPNLPSAHNSQLNGQLIKYISTCALIIRIVSMLMATRTLDK